MSAAVVNEVEIPKAGNGRHRWAFVEMLVSSLLSLTASLVLSIDAIVLAKDPLADLSCNISDKISCGTVGVSWQANLLGFPNAFLGLICEPVVITLAVAALGGVRFPRWFMNTAMGVYLVGLCFAYWLFVQAYFVIGALCPWCLLITAMTTTVFVSMLRVCILDNTFHLSARVHARLCRWLHLGIDVGFTVLFFAVLIAAVAIKYL